ncbi:hypothetical protein [Nocardia sp. XZ_19_385]|uniref:hypothetical protein n=1 Tax=Nocardia sp. XZ_19_385 TaxID=2769488 RepID=UPI00188FB936|nr:hypothetical protein [Nocardia sp. XZ_19_385]
MSDTQDADIEERFYEPTWNLLDSVWAGWGRIDPEYHSPRYQSRIFPAEIWNNMGINEAEPASVEHPSFRVIRRQYGVLATSYGLSFPIAWSDADPTNGVEVEVFAAATGTDFAEMSTADVLSSWLGQMVRAVTENWSSGGFSFTNALQRYGTLTITLPGVQLPAEAADYLDDNGNPTVLLGVTDPGLPERVDGPLSPIRLVGIKLLTRAETQHCVSGTTGVEDARTDLARLLAGQGEVIWSSLTRPSVV